MKALQVGEIAPSQRGKTPAEDIAFIELGYGDTAEDGAPRIYVDTAPVFVLEQVKAAKEKGEEFVSFRTVAYYGPTVGYRLTGLIVNLRVKYIAIVGSILIASEPES
jgi:hypothetical protein